MACSRGAKRSAVFLLKELSTYRQFACSYSSQAFRGQVVEARGVGRLPYSFSSNSLRRFSAEVSVSEQMNLIRQLRERTSAPIKDVKSSLASCNWDIGGCMCLPLYLLDLFSLYFAWLTCGLMQRLHKRP